MDQRDAVSSPSLTDETLAKALTSSLSLHAPPQLPTLPLDLISEILTRLPVKLLLQLRSVCKSWNSLISDSKFAMKHLRLSNTHLVHTSINSSNYVLKSYPLDSVFDDVTTNPIVQVEFPSDVSVYHVGSFNGILCLLSDFGDYMILRLWNPSIRKFKELPSLQKQQNHFRQDLIYGFGYDVITNAYNVVVGLRVRDTSAKFVDNHEVKVHTLGTNSWKTIQKFPFGCVPLQLLGKFVSGTINWLVYNEYHKEIQIVSLDLGNESYKEVLLPKEVDVSTLRWHLGVLRDCLCLVFGHDVWIMKEHGNKDSWTKLYSVSYMRDHLSSYATIEVLHIFEDGRVLLDSISTEECTKKLVFYNSRNGTTKFSEPKIMHDVCVESLISPCS
ncbi:putative F-box domain-containing protein [Medicago truncatula]|uniref:F-box protein interaction domain protein n=1 Tax=Medicago truncatula TaxID=3880 RepID=A0A072V417_MEDTR|nr:F-box/kelch-repeat protein At3g23880 [Medicago truncatula]KEH32860.1 F-box protein interaction domain protein [Medicago truncatula]RHN65413.1 putative F-box domain-containing protein [Medicago truncatula]